jgi:MFS family permease
MHSDHHTDWVGRRRTLFGFTIIFSVGAVCVSIILPDVSILILVQILTTIAGGSRGIGYIYSGRVISGIGIGGMSAVSPAYVSECSPKDVRGRITGIFQLMVAIGVMTSYFINRLVRVLPYYLERAHVILEQLVSAFTCRTAPWSGEFLSDFSLFQLV